MPVDGLPNAAPSKAGQAPAGKPQAGLDVYKELRGLAEHVTVKFLGEGDGRDVSRTYFKKGPVPFTPKALADAMGFTGSHHQLVFNVASAEDLQTLVDSQNGEGATQAALKIKNLLSRPGVQVATLVMKDRTAVSSPAFLVAGFPDGSVIGLRGTVGGSSF
jgi:hypothetical protein